MLACQIIGNNAFNGYLSTSRQSSERITTAADGVLMEDSYFFIVPKFTSQAGFRRGSRVHI